MEIKNQNLKDSRFPLSIGCNTYSTKELLEQAVVGEG
jgi:hypothetical protein